MRVEQRLIPSRSGVTGIQRDGAIDMLFRFIEAILHQQGLAKIIFGLIIIRP